MPIVDGVLIPNTKIVNGIRIPVSFSEESFLNTMKMKPDPGDIVLATYPKCGTNWTKQILILLLNNGLPPRDDQEFMKKCPFLEFTGPDILVHQQPPRCYFCHFDYPNVPKSPEAKYICVIRNPKDCLISLYHFMKSSLFGFEDGNFDVIFDLFVKGESIYNDYFDHLMSWYERRNDSNVLFLYYEKMKSDIQTAIKNIAQFIGPKYEEAIKDDEFLNQVAKYSSFDYMKDTTNEFMKKVIWEKPEDGIKELSSGLKHALDVSSAKREAQGQIGREKAGPGKLVRKGIVGDWRNVLTQEQSDVMDELIEKRLKGTEMYDYWKSSDCI